MTNGQPRRRRQSVDYKRTLGNYVLIKLDPENSFIKLKSGFHLYIDTSYEAEKNITVTGQIWGLPSRLTYTGVANKGMPWKTELEVSLGDRVIVYYLAVVNALKETEKRYFFEGNDIYIAITYNNIFAVYGEGFVRPVNGYCLIEPTDNPWWIDTKRRMEKIGLTAVRAVNEKSNTHVVFGKVKYTGTPNQEYVDRGVTDHGVDVSPGDQVVMRKISDIPLQYDLHAKIDGGTKYWRVQRRSILAKI